MTITDERREQITLLIKHYNFITGYRCKATIYENQLAVSKALDAVDGEMHPVRVYITDNAKNYEGSLPNFFMEFAIEMSSKKSNTTVTTAEAVPVTEAAATNAIGTIEKVLVELLAKTKMETIQQEVKEKMIAETKNFIFNEYGPIERKVVLDFGDYKKEMKGVVHEKFDTVLKFVKANEPVFLTGKAGTGKNFLCKQVAEALNLDFYFTNAVTQEYKLTGFTDAMGTFHESQFYKAFKNGGLFMLDEMDASIPEVLIILNAAIANRYFDFPAPIGYVEAHPNFRVVAAGNTFGNGADYDYVGRNQLDAASLDRFALVEVDYDSRIEENCANGDKDLLKFCRAFRTATEKNGIRTVVSYRAISRMAKLSSCLTPSELIKSCLVKSLTADDLNILQASLQGCGRYTDGFNEIVENY